VSIDESIEGPGFLGVQHSASLLDASVVSAPGDAAVDDEHGPDRNATLVTTGLGFAQGRGEKWIGVHTVSAWERTKEGPGRGTAQVAAPL